MINKELATYISSKVAVAFDEPHSEKFWTVSKWQQEQIALEDLTEIQTYQQAPKANVTGSLVMKRVGFVLLGAMIAYYRTHTVWDMNKTTIKLGYDEDSVYFNLRLHVSNVILNESISEDITWNKVLNNYFHNWLKPLVLLIEKTCKVHQIILWENVFIYLKWFYEGLAPSLPEFERNDWAQQWEQIVDESFFGEDVANPFAHLNKTKAKREMENGSRVRHTCCYKYKLPNGTKCTTCSQLK